MERLPLSIGSAPMKLLLIVLTAALSTAPALAADQIPQTAPAIRSFPEIGVETEVEIGQPMAIRERIVTTTSLKLVSDVRSESVNGTRVLLTAGTYRLGRTTAKGRYFYGDGARIRALGITDKPPYGGGIFIPLDQTEPPATFWEALLGATISKAVDMQIQPGDQSGFRRELIYGGVAQGVVSVSYREFSDDFARPAFSQELRYDLKEGQEIGYRGARIEILRAGNTTIRFKLLKPLDEATSNTLAR